MDCFSCTLFLNQHWASLCPIRQHQVQYPPNIRCSPRLKSESFMNLSFALCAVWHSIRFSTFHMNPAWFLSSRENSSVASPVIFNFLGNLFSRTQTGLIQHLMLSHVLWCNYIHVNCPTDTITYAFTGSCRVLLIIFVPLSNSDSWICDVNVGSSN